jgi:hypothetical protein
MSTENEHFDNAAVSPDPGPSLAGSAESGWGQPPAGAKPARPPRRWWSMILPLLLVPALLAVFAGGWFYDYNGRVAALERGHVAFQQGDCTGALAGYAEAERGRVPWGSPAESPYPVESEKYQCTGLVELAADWEAGRFADTAKGYADFRTDNPDSPALAPLWALVQKSAKSKALQDDVPKSDACAAVESIRGTSTALNSDFAESPMLQAIGVKREKPAADDPKTLLACAATFEKAKQTQKAYDFYASALRLRPKGSAKTKATSGKARTDVQLARAANPGKLPTPERISGTGTGPAVVIVRNDSPDELELTMSGKKPVITTVPACRSCRTYPNSGPITCPDAGPKRTFRVPSGTYSVAVRSKATSVDQNVTPFVGSWNLTKGSRYESCFFIVTSKP